MRRNVIRHQRFKDSLLRIIRSMMAATILVAAGGIVFADGSGDPTAVNSEDGKYLGQGREPNLQDRA